jgi:DNA-binding NarL/FixJ family response regulator
MVARGAFLVVEDDPSVGRMLRRVLEQFRPTSVVSTARAAKKTLRTGGPWTGLVVDIGLPDGSGLDVVAQARMRHPLLPVLVLTGLYDPAYINRSHALQTEVACKPIAQADLVGFVQRAIAFERVPERRLARLIDELARQVALTPNEVELVAAALADVPRAALAEQLAISENTLKTRVRNLLAKIGHGSLDALVKQLLREALAGGEATKPVADPKSEK